MAHYFRPVRFLMLLACLWALFGAVMMFALAGAKLLHAAEALWMGGSEATRDIVATVMGATDASLFGVVLIIFACAIAFGFVFEMTSEERQRIPGWMQIENISEIKHSLIEVIIVYLVVDFATDLATVETIMTWTLLVKPLSIMMIAVALRLMTIFRRHGHQGGA